MPVQTTVQMRRDTAANWTSTNPTLASGEWGLETDTRLMKIGDGTTAWNSLAYQLGPMLDEVIATDPNGAYFTGSGLRMYGTSGNYALSPDSSALDITGDLDLRVKVAMDDWTPSSDRVLISKAQTFSTLTYQMIIRTDGKIGFLASSNGTTWGVSNISSVATGITDGATKWIRATFDVNNGASGSDVQFFTSDDGSTWTQLGTTQTNVGTFTTFASTAQLEIGSNLAGTGSVNSGTFYRAQVLNGIGGTTVFDANFESVASDSFAFTESSANAATVTLTTTRYSFGLPSQTLTGTGTASTNTNRTWYFPFSIRKPITLKHFAFESTTAPASNTTVRVGLYNADAQLQPTGSKIIDSGAITVVTGAAAIYRTRLTPTTLNPGNYVVAFNIGATAFTARVFRGGSSNFSSSTMGANLVDILAVSETLSGGALPTTGTKWNLRGAANAAFGNLVVLGWS